MQKIVPMYHQIYLTLKNDLERGRYRMDRPFPNEIVLAEKFGVSRVTLRRTLEMLQQEGLIVRKPGIGTFPAPKDDRTKFRSPIDNFFDVLANVSTKYEVTIIESHVGPTPQFILDRYPAFAPTSVQVKKLSRIKKKPVHFGTHYLPSNLDGREVTRKPSNTALLLQMKKAGVSSVQTDLMISAALADLEAAKLLEIQAGSAVITTRRLSLNSAGTPIEFLNAFTRPDVYEYVFRFAASDANRRNSRHE